LVKIIILDVKNLPVAKVNQNLTNNRPNLHWTVQKDIHQKRDEKFNKLFLIGYLIISCDYLLKYT